MTCPTQPKPMILHHTDIMTNFFTNFQPKFLSFTTTIHPSNKTFMTTKTTPWTWMWTKASLINS